MAARLLPQPVMMHADLYTCAGPYILTVTICTCICIYAYESTAMSVTQACMYICMCMHVCMYVVVIVDAAMCV